MNAHHIASAALAACLTLVPFTASADALDDRLARIAKAADCGDKASPLRIWCIAADFNNGVAGSAPSGRALVGVTLKLADGADARAAMLDKVSFAALATGPGGKVKLTDVLPTNKSEEAEMAQALSNVALVFKDKAPTAALPPGLAGYLSTVQGRDPVRKVGDAWEWTGASATKMRKVGKFWVVIETPKEQNGIFATVLTDAWQ